MAHDGLKPFFSYLGSKAGLAPHYPAPRYETVIEPFAGSAGYSLLHYRKDIVLYDADPLICGIWDYLIKASAQDIMSIPVDVMCQDDVKGGPEVKALVAFWFSLATSRPRNARTGWGKDAKGCSSWTTTIRHRIASQVRYIKHWKIVRRSYHAIETPTEATYFVDPPYQEFGHQYRYNDIDYRHLGQWCQALPGQAIVCDVHGANWLPFQRFRDTARIRSKTGRKNEEMIWTNDQ